MARKQNKILTTKEKIVEETNTVWKTLSPLDVLHFDKNKSKLASVLDPKLEFFWQFNNRDITFKFTKLFTNIKFAEYLRSTKRIVGVGFLKYAYAKCT